MKYVVQIEIDSDTGIEVESHPEELQDLVGMWQAHNPIGMFFGMTRRAVTIIVDVANEGVLFEALHATWVLTNSYPEVWPVADASEFPALMQRAGIGR